MKMLILSVTLALICCCHTTSGQGQERTKHVAKIGSSEKNAVKFSATLDFASGFYKQLVSSTEDSKNIVFSPLSMYIALSMVQSGARGNTKNEMEKALSWRKLIKESGSGDGDAAVKSLIAQMTTGSEKISISVANKLWIQKYFCLSSCNRFINKLRSNYYAELGQLNFARKAESCRKEINKWVEGKTNKKIKDLLPGGSVTAMTRFVLTNAIYFKGAWKYQFDKKDTTQMGFSVIGGKRGVVIKRVPMMYQRAKVRVSGFNPASQHQLLELPYEGDELSMVIVVPPTHNVFRTLEGAMSAAKLDEFVAELRKYPSRAVDVYLPKFKLSTSIDMQDKLERLGIRDLFDQSKADLSGITGYRGLSVGKAVHKAFINVDEEGTEASAATGIVINFRASPDQFIVNRPFIYMIRHNPSGQVLFMGRVMDPTVE